MGAGAQLFSFHMSAAGDWDTAYFFQVGPTS